MSHRVALLGIYHESNTFLDKPTTLSDFRKGHWLKGEAIRKEYQDAFHEIGGMLEILDREGIEVIPVMYAEATPGGMITAETYAVLLQEMMDLLEEILPVDGCLVVPHGAGVSEAFADMDGHWLSQLRARVGTKIPIIGTLDPHCNISQSMVAATDALVTYKTNPHVDQRQTGKEAALLMVNHLKGKIQPQQILQALPLAISIEQQHTESEPCLSLYAYAHQLREQEGILSLSISLGFPYADVTEMGSSVIVIADQDIALALSTGQKIEAYIREHLKDFSGRKIDVAHALALLEDSPKPVLMLDMGDNIGGGSPGNSTCLLEALEAHGKCSYFICLCDPEAVASASAYKIGETYQLIITADDTNAKKLEIDVTLLQLADGKFMESNPRHGGQVNFDMGNIAIVSTAQGSIIMFTSLRMPPFSLQQLLAFNINPEDVDVLVAKGVNAPIAAYAPVCATIIQVDTPGVTRADMTLFTYHNRRKPLFPFEK
ncbi:M81 family metallopeptidase [Chitinophaga sp. MM2321]|uniref:M81 family metallopeptidase n=1 Tax=Chitinophaga sp. MM2321 TaxID=3137178 RepID=UPI0032D5AF91